MVLVGSKAGGIVSVLAAHAAPGRYAGTVTMGTPFVAADTAGSGLEIESVASGMATMGLRDWVAGTMRQRLGTRAPDAAITWWTDYMSSADPAACAVLAQFASSIDLRSVLQSITIPTLFMSALGSPMFDEATMAAWASENELISTAIVPGDGYHIAVTEVAECVDHVTTFVEKANLLSEPTDGEFSTC
jgi:pimeloyl-ACP methyl ester carboxylesterase